MAGNPETSETSLKDGERKSLEFHERVAVDSVDIWRRSLNRLMPATDDLTGRKIGEEAEAVQFALFFRAWDTICWASDLAERGYYAQALNLLRSPIEDWMAYWFLRNLPQDLLRSVLVETARESLGWP